MKGSLRTRGALPGPLFTFSLFLLLASLSPSSGADSLPLTQLMLLPTKATTQAVLAAGSRGPAGVPARWTGRQLLQEQAYPSDADAQVLFGGPPPSQQIDFAPLQAGSSSSAAASQGPLTAPAAEVPAEQSGSSPVDFSAVGELAPQHSSIGQPGFPAGGPAEGALNLDQLFPSVASLPPQPPAAPGSAPPSPDRKKSSLVSLLATPAPGTSPPELSPQQQAARSNLSNWRQGKATVSSNRDLGNLGGGSLNCGMGYMSDYFKDNWVGIPSALYSSGEFCGACLRLVCVDSACQDALLRDRLFMIADSCRECQGNDLLISARGMGNLTGLNYDINPITLVAWELASCAPLIEGGIKLMPGRNNRGNYLALNFSNLKQPLRAVTINNLPMKYSSFGYWVIDTPNQPIPLKAPFTLALVGMNGQRLTKEIASMRPQDLQVQF